MPLVNHTPYPALAFQGVDTLGQMFHVVAARQTLGWHDDGVLFPLDEQRPLCEQDESVEVAPGRCVTVQESDLCQYKPRADVIVHATVHAPRQRAVGAFEVRLALRRPGYIALLLDKRLTVTGPRRFMRRQGLATLTGPRWMLTQPEPFSTMPLTLAHAWGGSFADKHQRRHACMANPAGLGWWDGSVPDCDAPAERDAPRIEYGDQPITASLAEGAGSAAVVAGLGLRPKSHPARMALAGQVDDDFARSTAALPEGFDFAVWNAAWPDQQLDELHGDEWIGLVNLCSADTPAARVGASGDTLLGLSLPGALPFVLVRWLDGRVGELPMRLDTLLIEPEQRRVSCIWRALVPLAPAVRVLELRELDAASVAAARQAASLDSPNG